MSYFIFIAKLFMLELPTTDNLVVRRNSLSTNGCSLDVEYSALSAIFAIRVYVTLKWFRNAFKGENFYLQ